MEPMTVGIMGILALFFVLVSLAAFKMLTKETTFEDVYGENAMRLFAEEKTGKQKTTKSTKSKAKNADKKKDHAQEKEKKRTSDSELQTKTVERKSEEPQQIVLEHAKPEKMADAKNVKQPDEENVKIVDEMPVLQQEMPKHTKKKNKNKQHQEAEETKAVERNTPPPSHEKQNVVDEPEVAVKVEVKATQQSQKKSASPAVAEVAGTEETSSASAEGVEKKAKKKRARRAEEQLHEVGTKEEMQPLMSTEPIKEQKQQVLAAKEEKKPEKEKPKPKKPAISVRDITVDKLHTRLSAVDDLEPEYLSFLAAYFSDTGALKTKLTDENATLRREVADKTKLAHQVVSDAQKKDSEIAHLKQSLTDEKKKYTLFEQSVCSQLSSSVHDKNELQRVNEQFKTEINNLKEELRKAQTALKAVPPPVDTTAFQQQVDMLRSELNNAQKKISQMEGELGQRNQVMQQMKADLQNNEARIEHMKKATAVKEQHFKESETSLKRERERLEAKLNDSLKAVDELQKLAADAIEERSASAQKAVEDCRNEYNNQLECMKQQLLAVEKERDMLKTEQANTQMLLTQKAAEQDNSHKEEVAKLNSQIAQLKELIDDEKAKLSTEKNERSKEVADLRKNIAELHGLYASEMEHVTAMKDRLQKADRAESEHKTTIARLEKDLADAKSKLAAAESSEDAELKCVHCAAASLTANRLPSSNGSDAAAAAAAAVGDVDSAMSQKTSAYNHKANTLTTNAQHHQNASLHSEETNDATDSEAPNATIAQTNGSTDATKQKVQSESAAPSAAPTAATHLQGVAGGTELDDGASEEENIVALQDAPESNMQNLDSATKLTVRFELKWPVPDWSRADAPKEVLVSGSFWDWKAPRQMQRCADGFKLDVELLAPGEGDCANRTPSSKSDSERVELIADREGGDHKKRYEFKFLVDGEWRCTEHYAKMLTDNGAFENNIVYV